MLPIHQVLAGTGLVFLGHLEPLGDMTTGTVGSSGNGPVL